VIECPGKAKLNTITDPFSGKEEVLEEVLTFARLRLYDLSFRNYFPDDAHLKLCPEKFKLSHSASPSNSVSFKGLLTDWALLSGNSVSYAKDLKIALMQYLSLLPETQNKRLFELSLSTLDRLVSQSPEDISFPRKCGAPMNNGLSQLFPKVEAAGKIRIFALVDSITQTFMDPLHKILFNFLRKLPNDGTFDQEASINRSKEKALKAGKA
jgi:hypothetical protein